VLITDPAGSALDEDPVAEAAPGAHELAAIRRAVAEHRETGDPAALERGFTAARALLSARSAPGDRDAPALDRLRGFADSCPEFGALLDAGADAAGASLTRATAALWRTLGLHGRAPAWTASERAAARTVLACACARPTTDAAPADWLPAGLRRIAAARIAGLIAAELGQDEGPWLRALGDRYGSLRHRCAPRTVLRSRGLADLIREDAACRAAVAARLETWLAGGGAPAALTAELEAAVVHARTPARLA
jgi:hypothetical protein